MFYSCPFVTTFETALQQRQIAWIDIIEKFLCWCRQIPYIAEIFLFLFTKWADATHMHFLYALSKQCRCPIAHHIMHVPHCFSYGIMNQWWKPLYGEVNGSHCLTLYQAFFISSEQKPHGVKCQWQLFFTDIRPEIRSGL